MANFDMVVDTSELAQALERVSTRVNVVAGTVVAMQTAVIDAQTAATDRVCKHVDEGFFALIRSQITQKMARYRSEVDSKFLEVHQQSQALLAIKSRMERDYHMIAARYARLFQAIDLSLRSRIFELDKPAFQLACHESERLSIRLRSMQARPSVYQMELLQAAQMLSVSRVKASASRVIGGMHSFLDESARQTRVLKNIVFASASNRAADWYAPMLMCESDAIGISGPRWEVSAPADPALEKISAASLSAAFASIPSLKWTAAANGERTQVSAAFQRRLESIPDERVRKKTAALFEASGWQTAGGGA